MKKITITVPTFLLAVLQTVIAAYAQSTPAFRPTLDAHLAAISGRNMDALLPTITDGKDLPMISPSGYKFDTRQQFVDFHRQWFAADDKGKLDFEIIQIIETPKLAHALIKYRYTSMGKDGKSQANDNWLALTFALEKGKWRLVFDQNTPITQAKN